MKLVWVGVALASSACGPRVLEQDTNADGGGSAGSHTDTPTSSSAATQSDTSGDGVTSSDESSSTSGPEVCLGSCDCEPSGALLWERVFAMDAVDGWDLALDADENLVLLGSHHDRSAADSIWLAKLDAEAAPLWSVTSAAGFSASVHVDADGRILVAGSAPPIAGWSAAALRIHGPDGELLEEILDEPANGSRWSAVTTDEAGNIIVVGTDHVDGSGGGRAMVRSYGPSGEVVFERSFVGTAGESMHNHASGVASRDGTIFVTGTLSNTHDYGEEDIWSAALDDGGATMWEDLYDSRSELAVYADLGWDRSNGLALASDGGVLVFGDHRVEKPTDGGSISTNERWARLYAVGGAPQWTWWRDDAVPVPGSARDATFDACGNAIIVGTEEPDSAETLFVAKLDPSGVLLWDQHGHPAPWAAGGVAVVARSDGSIVTLGNEDQGVMVISRYAP